ncbi:hypothetical protein [Amycolatopsis sp. WQ 127309]|uniref:hypothetical protein n=1 Tax=Amycolatopsis sp. WQ 127309 TaxID=2932773 RepID=UPI001FF266FA|nr:hypothetical protein [Amycolatopsis sp. WQ 127309]UOZ06918.1 hypothetical protein MUY22_01085 [Amycolatopsis sp. WQ 127309]
MVDSTKFSPEQIGRVSTKHKQTSDDISQQLNSLKAEIDSTLASSPSSMTRALSTTFDNWVESVRGQVLGRIDAMSDLIVKVSGNQAAADEEHGSKLAKFSPEVGGFLGGN